MADLHVKGKSITQSHKFLLYELQRILLKVILKKTGHSATQTSIVISLSKSHGFTEILLRGKWIIWKTPWSRTSVLLPHGIHPDPLRDSSREPQLSGQRKPYGYSGLELDSGTEN